MARPKSKLTTSHVIELDEADIARLLAHKARVEATLPLSARVTRSALLHGIVSKALRALSEEVPA